MYVGSPQKEEERRPGNLSVSGLIRDPCFLLLSCLTRKEGGEEKKRREGGRKGKREGKKGEKEVTGEGSHEQ